MQFACARAEALPFPDARFDMVIARVSLPYTNLRASLQEIRRVLKTGGMLWVTLHPFSMAWEQAKASPSYKGWIYFAYIVFNSTLFGWTQRQVPFLGRYESFQTDRGISRALAKLGFHEIAPRHGKHFLVTAKAK